MIEHELIAQHGILVLRPKGRLQEEDFEAIARTVDPYIEQHGALRGLMIEADHFPGWEGVEGMMAHIRFVKDHHRNIQRVAVVSDSMILSMLPKLAGKLVDAKVRHFDASDQDAALQWLASDA